MTRLSMIGHHALITDQYLTCVTKVLHGLFFTMKTACDRSVYGHAFSFCNVIKRNHLQDTKSDHLYRGNKVSLLAKLVSVPWADKIQCCNLSNAAIESGYLMVEKEPEQFNKAGLYLYIMSMHTGSKDFQQKNGRIFVCKNYFSKWNHGSLQAYILTAAALPVLGASTGM